MSGLPPVAIQVLEGYVSIGAVPIWVACDATWFHGDIWDKAVAEIHVSVHGPTAARVCVGSQWSVLPPKASWMARVWAVTCGIVGVLDLCHS